MCEWEESWWSVPLSLFQSKNHFTGGFFIFRGGLDDVFLCKRNSSKLVRLFCEEIAEDSLEGSSVMFTLFLLKGIVGHLKMQNYWPNQIFLFMMMQKQTNPYW